VSSWPLLLAVFAFERIDRPSPEVNPHPLPKLLGHICLGRVLLWYDLRGIELPHLLEIKSFGHLAS